jgi:hypothetical protein
MATMSKVLRYTAFGATILVGVLGGAFIVAETLTDPGGAAGALLSAAWTVPTAILATYALARPAPAAAALTAVAIAVAACVAIDEMVGIVPRDKVGPVGAIAVVAAGVALGFLGLRRPARAGGLLVLVATANLVGVLGRMLVAEGGSIRHAFGGSSGAAAVPVLVLGVLFLLAAWTANADRPPPRPTTPPHEEHADRGERPAHTVAPPRFWPARRTRTG